MNIEVLLDRQGPGKLILAGIEDHHDAISAHCVLMHQAMNTILGPLMYQGAKGRKLKDELVKEAMVKTVRHLMAMCEACQYDLPEEEELLEAADEQNYLLKHDSVLTVTDMMMAALDIIHNVHVDLEGITVWAEEAPSIEMQQNIKSILLGIRNLGRKHNFTLKDVALEL